MDRQRTAATSEVSTQENAAGQLVEVKQDWINRYVKATEGISSPELFRKWGAISAIAGALERKVWVYTKKQFLYPNLYIFLIAPPGVGKTETTDKVRQMWLKLEDHHVSSSSITAAALIDHLDRAERKLLRPSADEPVISFNSLLVAANEIGVLLPAYEGEMMNTLTDLYDCKVYSQDRRGFKDGAIVVDNPQLNLLAAGTPGYLKDTLPPTAWDMGFLSRVIMVYWGEKDLGELFVDEEDADTGDPVLEALQDELTDIGNLYGRMSFTPEAKTFLTNWYVGGQPPVPDHPRLHNYNTRRITHLLKLSIIMSVAESRDMIIEERHAQAALETLIEAELYMPEIFKAMTSGGDSNVIDDTWHYVYKTYMSEGKKGVSEHRLIAYLQQRTPAHNIMRVIEIMERAKVLEKRLAKGGNIYVPRTKD